MEEFIINSQPSLSSLSINNVHSLHSILLEDVVGLSLTSLSFSNLHISSLLQIGELNFYKNTLPQVHTVEIEENCLINTLVIGERMFREVEKLKLKGNHTVSIEIGNDALNRIEGIELGRN